MRLSMDQFQLVVIWGVVAIVRQGIKMAKDFVLRLFGVHDKSIKKKPHIEIEMDIKEQALHKD